MNENKITEDIATEAEVLAAAQSAMGDRILVLETKVAHLSSALTAITQLVQLKH